VASVLGPSDPAKIVFSAGEVDTAVQRDAVPQTPEEWRAGCHRVLASAGIDRTGPVRERASVPAERLSAARKRHNTDYSVIG